MPPQTRIRIAKPDILKLFRANAARVYTRADLERILAENRAFWRLAQSTTVNRFIDFMLDQTDLRLVTLRFPSRSLSRYTWGDVPLWELIQTLNPQGYFTHYSAMYLHGLTDQIPKTVYFNCEQSATGGGGRLTQDSIQRAFKAKCRVSNNVADYAEHRICTLNGQNTGHLGVVEEQTTDGSCVRTTSIERTLIDATVRPVYSGGVFEVLRAYRLAQGRFSVNTLTAILRKLHYTYPYHHAIGFYLDRAGGYKPSQIELLRQFEFKYDFYLAHEMVDVEYNERWRLFVPKGF